MSDILYKNPEEKYKYVLELLEKSENTESDGNVQLRRYLEQVKNLVSERFEDEPHWAKISCEWLNRNINSLFGKNWEFLDFGLKLLGLLCRSEDIFNCFLRDGVIQQVIDHHANDHLSDARLQHAYIMILRAMTTHNSGLQVIKSQNLWRVCMKEHSKSTYYLVRESATLLYDILRQLDLAGERIVLREVLAALLSPLMDSNEPWLTDSIKVNDQENYENLVKMLERLENLLILMYNAKEETTLAYELIIGFALDKKLWSSTLFCINRDYQVKLLRVATYANFVQYGYMRIPETDTTLKPMDLREFYVNFYNFIGYCIQYRDPNLILMLMELTNHLCYNMQEKSPADIITKNNLTFGDQVLILQLLPVLFKIKKFQCTKSKCMEEFCEKFFSTVCEQTVRHMYALRDVINQTSVCIGVVAVKSVKGLISMSNYLSRSRGILAFQGLIYILKEYVPDTETKTLPNGFKKTDLVLECSNLLSIIFSGLHTFVQKFNISWTDCMESTSIVDLSLSLLNNPSLSGRLSVQALNLVRLAIEHFLSPNMVLLMDNLEGSPLEKLGPTIVKRLQDNEGDVRNATAELLVSVVEISRSKFPGFKKHILINKICPMIVDITENDRDPYVRCSALRCLSQMVEIKQFWVHVFASMNLIDRLLLIVREEPEGIIRTRATGCLVSISAHQQLPTDIVETLFSTMAHLATNDLYYDVKTQAINFWSAYLEELFHNQGALDGKFPKETFSREHKKIVQLTPDQIKRRLTKIIDAFSAKGGFGVLLAVLYDESDIEVVKACVTMIQNFMSRLWQYNYVTKSPEKITEISINGHYRPPVSDEDINLLAKAYAKLRTSETTNGSCTIDEMNEDDEAMMNGNSVKIDAKYYKIFTTISGDEFIDIISRVNLEGIINGKTEWLQSTQGLDSVLDDVILSFTAEKYEMECY
ncbi:uncharacterized protein LOC134834965 [Culicoides brevitarsis]|uniref:uncharacterized protein LOC134834965 n=1 Tax=Culicoides brevitarsis TaxID=469753 RepID=UPI00307C6DEA